MLVYSMRENNVYSALDFVDLGGRLELLTSITYLLTYLLTREMNVFLNIFSGIC